MSNNNYPMLNSATHTLLNASTMFDTYVNHAKSIVTSNTLLMNIIMLFALLYITVAVPSIPEYFTPFFSHFIVQSLFVLLFTFTVMKNTSPLPALVFTIAFMLTLQILRQYDKHKSIYENIKSLSLFKSNYNNLIKLDIDKIIKSSKKQIKESKQVIKESTDDKVKHIHSNILNIMNMRIDAAIQLKQLYSININTLDENQINNLNKVINKENIKINTADEYVKLVLQLNNTEPNDQIELLKALQYTELKLQTILTTEALITEATHLQNAGNNAHAQQLLNEALKQDLKLDSIIKNEIHNKLAYDAYNNGNIEVADEHSREAIKQQLKMISLINLEKISKMAADASSDGDENAVKELMNKASFEEIKVQSLLKAESLKNNASVAMQQGDINKAMQLQKEADMNETKVVSLLTMDKLQDAAKNAYNNGNTEEATTLLDKSAHEEYKLNILLELDNIKDSANNALNAGNYEYSHQLLNDASLCESKIESLLYSEHLNDKAKVAYEKGEHEFAKALVNESLMHNTKVETITKTENLKKQLANNSNDNNIDNIHNQINIESNNLTIIDKCLEYYMQAQQAAISGDQNTFTKYINQIENLKCNIQSLHTIANYPNEQIHGFHIDVDNTYSTI